MTKAGQANVFSQFTPNTESMKDQKGRGLMDSEKKKKEKEMDQRPRATFATLSQSKQDGQVDHAPRLGQAVPSVHQSHGVALGRSSKLPQRQADPGRGLGHDASAPGVKGRRGAQDGEDASGTIDTPSPRRVGGGDELRDAEEEEGQHQEAQDHENGNVGAQRGNEEDEGEEAPQDEEDAQREAEGTGVARVGVLDAQRRDQEHGES